MIEGYPRLTPDRSKSMIKGSAPKTPGFSDIGWNGRVLHGLFWLASSYLLVSVSSVNAAEYSGTESELAAPSTSTSVPWMVEDQQSATNFYRSQDTPARQAQSATDRSPGTQQWGTDVAPPRQQQAQQHDWQVEQWSGRRAKITGGQGTSNTSNNQNPLAVDASVRPPDRFADNPQLDADGIRHFSNGKHFDLNKISLVQAVDTTNASPLNNQGRRPNHPNRPGAGSQFAGGSVANTSYNPPLQFGGGFGNQGGGFGNQSGGFGNQSGQFSNQRGQFANQAGRFNNQAGGFSNQGRPSNLEMQQRRQIRQARRMARLIREW
jgi:hypothetical protein